MYASTLKGLRAFSNIQYYHCVFSSQPMSACSVYFFNYHITVEMYTLRIAILQFDTNMPFSKYCPPVGRKGETKCTENSKNLRHKVNMNLLGYSLATCQQCVQMNSSVGDKKEWWWRAFMTNQVMNIRLVVTVFEILISVLSDRYLNLWPSVNY